MLMQKYTKMHLNETNLMSCLVVTSRSVVKFAGQIFPALPGVKDRPVQNKAVTPVPNIEC